MKKILLTTALLVWFLIAGAQYYEAPRQLNDGSHPQDTVVMSRLRVIVPYGWSFLNSSDTRELLKTDFGASEEQISSVVGMLSDPLSDSKDIPKRGYVIELFEEAGYVSEGYPVSVNFNALLERINGNLGQNGSKAEWAWQPSYDEDLHVLTIPLLIKQPDGSETLMLNGYIFGNESIINVSNLDSEAGSSWYRENLPEVIEAVRFLPDFSYSYYGKESDIYYESLDDFLSGNQKSRKMESYMESSKNRLGLPDVGRGWWIASIALAGIALIFFLLSFIMPGNDVDIRRRIAKKSRKVMYRLGAYFSVYLLMILWGVFCAYYMISLLVSLAKVNAGVFVLVLCALVIMAILLFLFLLVKPWFRGKVPVSEGLVEIHREQAPELFSMIEETSKEAGAEMPRRVFVSADSNAKVMPVKRLSSLFRKAPKDLAIGLGLLYFTNKSELKAILAHEFGHFNQKGLKTGALVAQGYGVLDGIFIFDSKFDGVLLVLLSYPLAISLRLINTVMSPMYVFVQRGFSDLRKDMELEADNTSADIAGPEAAISALNKLPVIVDRFNVYHELLNEIGESDRKGPTSYWNGYEAYLKMCAAHDGVEISPDTIVSSTLLPGSESSIQVENIWETHPTLKERLDNILSRNRNPKEINRQQAIDLVPSDILEEVSQALYNNTGLATLETLTDSEYAEFIRMKLQIYTFPLRVRPYFIGFIPEFNLEGLSPLNCNPEELFNEENKRTLFEFNRAIADYYMLKEFKEKKTPYKKVRYNGKVYSRRKLPLEEQEAKTKVLEEKTRGIESDICRYAIGVAENPDLITGSYADIFYGQKIRSILVSQVIPERNKMAAYVSKLPPQLTTQQLDSARTKLIIYDRGLQEFLRYIEFERLYPVLHTNQKDDIEGFMNFTERFHYHSIDGGEVGDALSMPDKLLLLVDNFIFYSKKKIADTIEGVPVVLNWGGSVSEAVEENGA